MNFIIRLPNSKKETIRVLIDVVLNALIDFQGIALFNKYILIVQKDLIMLYIYKHIMYFDHFYPNIPLFGPPLPIGYFPYSFLLSCLFFKGLDSTNERNHVILVFLSLAYFA
jgi:hypothetical protein